MHNHVYSSEISFAAPFSAASGRLIGERFQDDLKNLDSDRLVKRQLPTLDLGPPSSSLQVVQAKLLMNSKTMVLTVHLLTNFSKKGYPRGMG